MWKKKMWHKKLNRIQLALTSNEPKDLHRNVGLLEGTYNTERSFNTWLILYV